MRRLVWIVGFLAALGPCGCKQAPRPSSSDVSYERTPQLHSSRRLPILPGPRMVSAAAEVLLVVDVPRSLALARTLDPLLQRLVATRALSEKKASIDALLREFRKTTGIDLRRATALLAWFGAGKPEMLCFAAPIAAVERGWFKPTVGTGPLPIGKRISGTGYLYRAGSWGVVCEGLQGAIGAAEVHAGKRPTLTDSPRFVRFTKRKEVSRPSLLWIYAQPVSSLGLIGAEVARAMGGVALALALRHGGLSFVAEPAPRKLDQQLAALNLMVARTRSEWRAVRAALSRRLAGPNVLGVSGADLDRFGRALEAARFSPSGSFVRLELSLPQHLVASGATVMVVGSSIAAPPVVVKTTRKPSPDVTTRKPSPDVTTPNGSRSKVKKPRRFPLTPPFPLPNAQPKDTEYLVSLDVPAYLEMVKRNFALLLKATSMRKFASFDEMLNDFTKVVGFDPRKVRRLSLWMRFAGPDVACFAVPPSAVVPERFVKHSVHEGVTVLIRTSGGGSMATLGGYAVICDRIRTVKESIEVFKGKKRGLWQDDDGEEIVKLYPRLTGAEHLVFFRASSAFKLARTSELRDVMFAVGVRSRAMDLWMRVPPKQLDRTLQLVNELLNLARGAWRKLVDGLAKAPKRPLPMGLALDDLARFGAALGATQFKIENGMAHARLDYPIITVARLLLAWLLLRESAPKKPTPRPAPGPVKGSHGPTGLLPHRPPKPVEPPAPFPAPSPPSSRTPKP